MNKKIWIFLGISLAINCVFIGFEGSRMRYQQTSTPSARVKNKQVLPKMPNDLKSLGFKLMQNKEKEEFSTQVQDMYEAMRKVKSELNKDPFEEDKFRAAVREAAQIRISLDKLAEENMVEIIAKMPPEERHSIAEHLERKDAFFKRRRERRTEEARQRGESPDYIPPQPPVENRPSE